MSICCQTFEAWLFLRAALSGGITTTAAAAAAALAAVLAVDAPVGRSADPTKIKRKTIRTACRQTAKMATASG
eukprot:CAMPEP_0206452708 /NCGR_PEP_ID=MMETSP0324_2-20121206/20110_1 /ASSEMBLY_ACC=CAM_ASM_000836 /TAXON_ID=2866 /ORGANISM="Crypthecodinium cohnii, Strain Seligo" /LENGTH=72 /DNA_ID=CAMNT_0053922857 /DNA_START=361 /DNA_END=579 /DNA_ORIENTATION=+